MVTIADVARHAGVARSTVSYVLTGRRSISEPTRRAVERAIAELDYQPHAGARALRGARTQVLALSQPSAGGTFRPTNGLFIHEINMAAREYGYDLLLLTSLEGIGGIRRVAGSRLADGAVLMSVRTEDPRIAVLRDLHFPAALLGRPNDPRGLAWCDFDFEGAAAMAVRELARSGHQAIVVVAASDGEFREGLNYAPRTIAGARAEARANGIVLTVIRRSPSQQTMARRLSQALATDPTPTAVVTHDDHAAVLSIARERGLSVPDDLSIVVVSDTSDHVTDPPLARVELPIADMARLVVTKAITALRGEEDTAPTLIPPRLIRGRSIRVR